MYVRFAICIALPFGLCRSAAQVYDAFEDLHVALKSSENQLLLSGRIKEQLKYGIRKVQSTADTTHITKTMASSGLIATVLSIGADKLGAIIITALALVYVHVKIRRQEPHAAMVNKICQVIKAIAKDERSLRAYDAWQRIWHKALSLVMANGVGQEVVGQEVVGVGLHSFVGIWEDEYRRFRIKPDGSVVFEWSSMRDVSTFSTTSATYDPVMECLRFTLTFPADRSNPTGCSHWQLYPCPKAVITFDQPLEALEGRSEMEASIRFRKPMVGKWLDEHRVIQIQIFSDYNVTFQKAARPIDLLSVKDPGSYDHSSGVFSFTVRFPPDASNPQGVAHWHLREDGMLKVTFDEAVPNYGKAMPETMMTFQPVE